MQNGKIKIHLAPMEGVFDSITREIFSQIGGYDFMYTEFVRVSGKPVPKKVFLKYAPELHTEGKTSKGTPVRIQLLGSDPASMTENALKAVAYGSPGVDVNFGCPARRVNQHHGGAALLKNPKEIFDVLSAIRKLLPKEQSLSAKIRLGFDNKELCLDIAKAAEEAGAAQLIVHARTRAEAYRPPAHWEYIAKIKEHISIPVIANGDIFSVEDFKRCKEVTDCDEFCLGRGAFADPYLALKIKGVIQPEDYLEDLKKHFFSFIDKSVEARGQRFALNRSKQWSKYLGANYPYFKKYFEENKQKNSFAN